MESRIQRNKSSRLEEYDHRRPWSFSKLTACVTVIATLLISVMFISFMTRQVDPKGCAMSYMRPIFAHFPDFDVRYTRFSQKYSLYLYREGVVDEDTRVKGVPVIFVPGNAGSYKQARSLAAEAALYYKNTIQISKDAHLGLKRPLDFFSIDFNQDFGAFHGRTLLDQAEYLNDAISYILALYQNSHRSIRDPELPLPKSIILIGHSMGGIVARTVFTLPNYQRDTVNTIITLASPHALAPISFDGDIVRTYKIVNDYWRREYSKTWAINSPLWEVSVISIAGGGLDGTVPSEYSTLASIVPRTHGFAVYSSSVPTVWTSMDHLAITWCDQLRKVIIKALYDAVDASSLQQTRPREDRMKIFRRHFLSGLESNPGDTRETGHTAVVEVDSGSAVFIPPGERLIIKPDDEDNGRDAVTYLMPISTVIGSKTLKVIANHDIAQTDQSSLKVMLCNISSSANHAFDSDVPETWARHESEKTHLTCKDTHLDRVLLPASTSNSQQPFDHFAAGDRSQTVKHLPFSFLQYDTGVLSQFQTVAVFHQTSSPQKAWVIAEFSSQPSLIVQTRTLMSSYLLNGLEVNLTNEALLSEIRLPALHSSLIAYKARITVSSNIADDEVFRPILRQSVIEPFESKFFVNTRKADINVHGTAPYVPILKLRDKNAHGLLFQIWSYPYKEGTMQFHLRVDVLGSVGRLWMRYRSVFIISPLIVAALVFQKQLRIYDRSGSYISFSYGIDQCLRSSIPKFFFALTLLNLGSSKIPILGAIMIGPSSHSDIFNHHDSLFLRGELSFGSNDLLSIFLAPFFGIIGVGTCALLSFATLAIIHGLAILRGWLAKTLAPVQYTLCGPLIYVPIWIRFTATGILLLLVATVTPYQFAFLVICFVQIATCIRAQNVIQRNNHTVAAENFFNYSHSVAMFLLLILPINIPTLVVWIHNIAVSWWTPFSSDHNILSILPFLVYVQVVNASKTVPQLSSPLKHVSNGLFVFLAGYGAVFGATYGYILHSIANKICFCLTAVHLSAGLSSPTLSKTLSYLKSENLNKNLKEKKRS